jgi:serine/threonine-protein kinase HipA
LRNKNPTSLIFRKIANLQVGLNPSIDKEGLALNIDTHNNALDFELAKSAGEYFRLNNNQMEVIIQEVTAVVSQWQIIAKERNFKK